LNKNDNGSESFNCRMRKQMMLVCWICAIILSGCAVHSPNIQADKITFTADARRNLTGLRIMHDMTGSVEITKVGEKWVIAESDFPVDDERINSALDLVFGLANQPGRLVTSKKNPEMLEAYGLSLDRAKIVDLIFGKQEIRLRLGTAGENFETTYWTQEERDGIFQASGNLAWGIAATPAYWKSRVVLPQFGPGNDIKELNVAWVDSANGDQSYRMVRVGLDSAILVGNDTLGVPRKKALELIGHARQFVVDDFFLSSEEEKQISARHNDPTLISVTVVLENGDRLGTHAIKGDGEYFYATNPSGHWVKVLKWRFEDLMVAKASITSGIPLGPEQADGTESALLPNGFGVFAPHQDDSKQKSEPTEDKQEP
jgi:hypothetical protein